MVRQSFVRFMRFCVWYEMLSAGNENRAVAERDCSAGLSAKTPKYRGRNGSTHLEENLEGTMIVQFTATRDNLAEH